MTESNKSTDFKKATDFDATMDRLGEANRNVKEMILKFTGLVEDKENLAKQLEEAHIRLKKTIRDTGKNCQMCFQYLYSNNKKTDGWCQRCITMDTCLRCGKRIGWKSDKFLSLPQEARVQMNCVDCSQYCRFCDKKFREIEENTVSPQSTCPECEKIKWYDGKFIPFE